MKNLVNILAQVNIFVLNHQSDIRTLGYPSGEPRLGPHGRSRVIGARDAFGHRFTPGLYEMDAAREHAARRPCLVLLAMRGAVRPNIAGCVANIDDQLQPVSVTMRSRGHRFLRDRTEAAVDADMDL